MKVVTIIQARTSSRRLPNKVLLDIYGISLLERVVEQAKKIGNSDEVWVATSTDTNDDLIEMMCGRIGVGCFRGSLTDVRSRYHAIAKEQVADIVVRITADNPLTEPAYAEELINAVTNEPECDYAQMDKSTILDGTGSEVFTFEALERSVRQFDTPVDREHVTYSMYRENNMKAAERTPADGKLVANKPYFVGIDTFDDYKHSCRLFEAFGNRDTLKQIIDKLKTNGQVF